MSLRGNFWGETMTFTELAQKRLADLRSDGGSERTDQNYTEAYELFKDSLKAQGLNDDVREFTPENVDHFKSWYIAQKGVTKTSSLSNRLAALASLGKWGAQHGKGKGHRYLASNPLDAVSRPKKNKPEERWLYVAEIRALLDVECPVNERIALAMLFYTNLRASAASNAKVRDLSLDGDQVKLSVLEKGGKRDVFDLPAELAEPMIAYLKQREAGPDEIILVSSTGKPFGRSGLSEMVARLALKAGITRVPVRAHLFARHSPASIAGQKGASAFEIAAMLRHSDLSTARKYTHGVSANAPRKLVMDLVRG